MKSKGSKYVPEMIKNIPRCPFCKSNNTVGVVNTFVERKSKNGRPWYSCSKAYYCSNCLTEWDKLGVIEPMYA